MNIMCRLDEECSIESLVGVEGLDLSQPDRFMRYAQR